MGVQNGTKEIEYKVTQSGCWECTSHSLNKNGYPTICRDRKIYIMHRYVYIQKYGKITSEVIRHKCDNPKCINPEHLVEGTHADNVNDRVMRNRSANGINHGRSKLTEVEVMDIYVNSSLSNKELSRIYNVDQKAIYCIKKGKTWKHVTGNQIIKS